MSSLPHDQYGDGSVNTLKCSTDEKHKLIGELEMLSQKTHPKRSSLRVSFRREDLLLKIVNPLGNEQRFRVFSRNLSRNGMSVLLGRYIHPHHVCFISVPTIGGEVIMMRAQTKWCRHVRGVAHEVGLMFDAPIDLEEFIRLKEEEAQQYATEMAREKTLAVTPEGQAPGPWAEVVGDGAVSTGSGGAGKNFNSIEDQLLSSVGVFMQMSGRQLDRALQDACLSESGDIRSLAEWVKEKLSQNGFSGFSQALDGSLADYWNKSA